MEFLPADILIPKKDFEKWSTVACDQYTSDAEYWNDVEKIVADAPSALRLMLPEIYLENNDVSKMIDMTYNKMEEYTAGNIFNELTDSFIYVERTLSNGKTRKGLVGMFDLEAYDFNKGSSSLIRATEGTVLSRIPPRVKIREKASLEMPHIMVLIDDRKKAVIEPIEKKKYDCEKVYDFDLMKNGGHIAGYKVSKDAEKQVLAAISDLYDKKAFAEKYGIEKDSKPLLVFAVGDGNHSLATAKTCWENIKKTLTEEEQKTHPARYALAELVNLHDESLQFEPIHRVVFNADVTAFTSAMTDFFRGYDLRKCDAPEENGFTIVCGNKKEFYVLGKPHCNLTVGDVQEFLDTYIKALPDTKIDYIHDDDAVYNFAKDGKNIGILLPAMQKNDLFKTVILDGVLPRKTFSMGHADDKRYYLEVRKIK